MSFFSSLFCCGPSSSKVREVEDKEPNTRIHIHIHHRASSIRSNQTSAVRENRYSLPPRYEDIFCGDVLRVGMDEKDANIYSVMPVAEEREEERRTRQNPVDTVDTDGYEGRQMAPSISDHSSVISIPSTRLSGLASSYTGNTIRSGRVRVERTGESHVGSVSVRDSYTWSEGDGDLLPEYYAESVVADYAVGEDEDGHPVMADGWLDRLRSNAEREGREEWRRR